MAVTDDGMQRVAELQNLEFLDLSWNKITDAGLERIAELRNLERLDLGCCTRITDAGLAHFGQLSRLQSLNLGLTRVTDAALVALEGLPALRRIGIRTFGTLAHGAKKWRRFPEITARAITDFNEGRRRRGLEPVEFEPVPHEHEEGD
jgi:internalin A